MAKLGQAQQAYWVIVYKEKLLRRIESPLVPQCWPELEYFHHLEDDVLHIGDVEDLPVMLIDLQSEHYPEEHFEAVSLRSLLMELPSHYFSVVSKAWQTALFLRTHRFCGQCGHTMTPVDWELATHCDRCQHRCYPRVSPCIIVAIRKGSQILLAHGRHHKNNMYSTLAGFVESGETLEHAVHREVFEEVGIKVKNLRYFGSQPWPFPHSLMCGFLADYDEGDIKVDEHEIEDAQWFDIDKLPVIPPVFSIAGQLIEATLSEITSVP